MKEKHIVVQKPVHKNFRDIEGEKFGKLLVKQFIGSDKNNHSLWKCECECGKERIITSQVLKKGKTKSCGCLGERIYIKHGYGRSPELLAFFNAKNRCQNPKYKQYKDYGGRGIQFKFDSFEEFLNDIGLRPSESHSLNRIDNNGHYESGNIEWTLRLSQQRNTRYNHLIKFNGDTKCISEWSEITGINKQTICSRLNDLKWCTNCTLTIIPRKGFCKHKI